MLLLIAGITGRLGQLLATNAISRGISVRGLARDPTKLNSELSIQLESFVQSENYYDVPALDKAVTGVDAIISAYNPQPLLNLDGNLLLLRAAERANIKVFFSSTWNLDWTKIKFGDYPLYDPHIAFEQQAALTSSIRPVYLFTGLFHTLLLSHFGPGSFDASGSTPQLRYWGDGDKVKYPWVDFGEIAPWTIEVLLNGKGVLEGDGGFFKFSYGEYTIRELAAAYEEVTGTKVEVIRQGSLEELEELRARELKEHGRGRLWEYASRSFELISTKGLWECKEEHAVLGDSWKPTPRPLLDLVKELLASA